MEAAVADAVQWARAQVLKRPRSAEAWGGLGEVFLANEMEAESQVCFAEAERLDPRNPRWPYYQSGPLLNRGDRDLALPYLRRAVDRCDPADDSSMAPRLRLADTLLTLNQREAAEGEIKKVLQRQPDNPQAHFYMATIALSRQDWDGGYSHLLGCLNSPSCRQKARVNLVAVCLQRGEAKEAEQYRRQAERLPADADWPDPFVMAYMQHAEKKRSRYRLAQDLEAAGHFTAAADVLRPMTERYPDDYLPFLTLGRVLARVGDYAEGERALRRSIELAPQRLQARYYLSLLLLREGERTLRNGGDGQARKLFEEAEAQAREALAVKPDYGYALMARGLSLKHLGRRAEALACLRRAVDCNPEHAELHSYLGEMLAEEGKKDEARLHLEEAVRLGAPNDPRPVRALQQFKDGKSH